MTALDPLFMDINSVYSGDELGLPYRDIMGEGIVNSGDLLVSQRAAGGANLSVDVAAGSCWIVGDDDTAAQPTYRCRQTGVHNLTITPDASNPLIVRVVAEIIDAGFAGASRLWRLRAIHGVAAGSPSAPALPSNAISLATVAVAAAAASIVNADITDTRSRAAVGGGSALLGSSTLGTTIASASSIAVTPGATHLLTGTTQVNTLTGGTAAGQRVTLIASGQATGVCVVFGHLSGGGNIKLRGGRNFGIYAQVPADAGASVGESLTFLYDGTNWLQVDESLRKLLDIQSVTASVSITNTVEASADTIATLSTITFDGATPICFDYTGTVEAGAASQASIKICLFDSTTSLGFFRVQAEIGVAGSFSGGELDATHTRRITPANLSKSYSFRGFRSGANGSANAGVGGAGAAAPIICRITRDI